MFARLIRSVKAARLVVDAFSAASEGRYDDAHLSLAKLGHEGDRDHEVRLLKGLLYTRSHRFAEALREYAAAYEFVSCSSRLNGPTKAYLETIAARGVFYAADRLTPENRPNLELIAPAELSDIRLDRVPRHIKRNFPLPDHPDWRQTSDLSRFKWHLWGPLKRLVRWTR